VRSVGPKTHTSFHPLRKLLRPIPLSNLACRERANGRIWSPNHYSVESPSAICPKKEALSEQRRHFDLELTADVLVSQEITCTESPTLCECGWLATSATSASALHWTATHDAISAYLAQCEGTSVVTNRRPFACSLQQFSQVRGSLFPPLTELRHRLKIGHTSAHIAVLRLNEE